MDTGIYVALSKQVALFRDMDATANNFANLNTTGYQAENLVFSQYLTQGSRQENKVAFLSDVSSYTDTQQGTLQKTGNALDVAIVGQGYFTVQTPLGVRYTRAGSFGIDGAGQLVTADNYPVLDSGGQTIVFDEIDRVIEVDSDGTVKVDNNERGLLAIVQFDNPQLLERTGHTLYRSDAPSRPAENFTLAAGTLERSNVEAVSQLTHMINTNRSLTETVQLINMLYGLERKASDTLAKTPTA